MPLCRPIIRGRPSPPTVTDGAHRLSPTTRPDAGGVAQGRGPSPGPGTARRRPGGDPAGLLVPTEVPPPRDRQEPQLLGPIGPPDLRGPLRSALAGPRHVRIGPPRRRRALLDRPEPRVPLG